VPPQEAEEEENREQRRRRQPTSCEPAGPVVHVTTTIELDADVDEIFEEEFEQTNPATIHEA
jgi:hypothetical protein